MAPKCPASVGLEYAPPGGALPSLGSTLVKCLQKGSADGVSRSFLRVDAGKHGSEVSFEA